MRINDRNLAGAPAADAGRAQESQKTDRSGVAKPQTAGASGTGDRVELSSTLSRLSQALGADSSGRASRVQSLAGQYQAGGYRPNSAATSRGMVTEALAAGSK